MNTDLEPYQGGTPEPADRPQVPSIASDLMPPRLPEVGRIRCGEKDATKGFPRGLKTFRFTSRERPLIEAVAKLYGGEVKPWASDEGPQWQVTSEANSIDVIVPTADLAFSQYFELWDGGGCQRRCDGHYEMLGDSQCRCNPADRKAGEEGTCKPTTRLGVFLPGVKGLGVWRLESHGKNAGSEIKGSVMLIAAYGAGLTRATLTTAIRPGRQRKPDGTYTPVRYVVPTLISSDDIGEYVDRAQLEASPVQGVLPAPFEYPDPRDDLVKALHATYREVYPKQPDETTEEDREHRLMWSELRLGRGPGTITTWNGPEAPETLTRADVQTLLDALESTPALTRGQAAPISPGAPSAAGADRSAGQATPVGSHVAASEGGMGAAKAAGASPAPNSTTQAPAEHHTAETEGEAAPADGTVPAGESRSDAGLPPGAAPTRVISTMQGFLDNSWGWACSVCKAGASGHPSSAVALMAGNDHTCSTPKAAPTKPAPTRTRHKTAPTGAPNAAQAAKQAATPRPQTYRYIPPSVWFWTLPTGAGRQILEHFGNVMKKAEAWLAPIAAQESDKPLDEWSEADQWPDEKVAVILAALEAEGAQQ